MESKGGSILALVGGILQFLTVGFFLILTLWDLIFSAGIWKIMALLWLFFAAIEVVIAIFAITASKWMKERKAVKKGAITALVCGVLGGNIVTLIGGILGII